MAFRFTCPACTQMIILAHVLPGERYVCPICGQTPRVPHTATPTDDPAILSMVGNSIISVPQANADIPIDHSAEQAPSQSESLRRAVRSFALVGVVMNLLGLCMVIVGFFMLKDMSIFLRPRLYGELATIVISIQALMSEKPDIRRYQIVLNFIFLIVPGVFGLLLRVNPETVTGSGLFLVVGSINALAMANIKKPMAWFLWLENRRNVERQRIEQIKTELQQYQ